MSHEPSRPRAAASPGARHSVRATGPGAETLSLQVKVKPNARASSLAQLPDGTWLAQLKSLPVDGRANLELIALVADHFGCAKARVAIRRGAAGRLKRVAVSQGNDT